MGQYYLPIFLDEKTDGNEKILAHMTSWDYHNGAKLMEHSFVGNHFMNTIENELSPKGKYSKKRLVWAGDYADNEPSSDSNLFQLCTDDLKIMPETVRNLAKYRYLLNHTKKEFVNMRQLDKGGSGWEVHPLSILTCEGNGRGGGDYSGVGIEYVGIWARDSISVANRKPKGFTEIKPRFKL